MTVRDGQVAKERLFMDITRVETTAHNYERRIVHNNIEAEIWEAMRVRWPNGCATIILWHRRTEPIQREAHNTAGEASVGIGTRIEVDRCIFKSKWARKRERS